MNSPAAPLPRGCAWVTRGWEAPSSERLLKYKSSCDPTQCPSRTDVGRRPTRSRTSSEGLFGSRRAADCLFRGERFVWHVADYSARMEDDLRRAQLPCRFFQLGACRRGEECAFAHLPLDSAQALPAVVRKDFTDSRCVWPFSSYGPPREQSLMPGRAKMRLTALSC